MKQLLLIDPESTSLTLSKRFLENNGFEVTACHSASEALDILLDPKFSMIISEVDIRGLDGFDLCRILQKYQINVPIMFLTTRDDITTRKEAEFAGVINLVSKQTEYNQLPHKVREVLHKTSPLAS